MSITRNGVVLVCALALSSLGFARAETDPGVRQGAPGAGGPLAGLTGGEIAFFNTGADQFTESQSVLGTEPGAPGKGLGPRFNGNSCVSCHAQPSIGGTSPAQNPSFGMASEYGANNIVPFFITEDGPIREARFRFNLDGSRDGGVHALYVISGRSDAKGCDISQPDFADAAAIGNLSLRIPSPVFGGGLIEEIPDNEIIANKNADRNDKKKLGIYGHENRNGNDGTISRFGWKAQNKSLMLFAAEAYNVEMGITNDIFPSERDEAPQCRYQGTPEDHADPTASQPTDALSDVSDFTHFMRFLAPPLPAPPNPSIANGARAFKTIGCALCHTPSMTTGVSSSAALSNQPVNLYSDLLVHHMGPVLADHIIQGNAGEDEFRTGPLWGLGQRIFFLHDGRARDLVEAIEAHASSTDDRAHCMELREGGHIPLDRIACASEANGVIENYNHLPLEQKQDLLNFLRSL